MLLFLNSLGDGFSTTLSFSYLVHSLINLLLSIKDKVHMHAHPVAEFLLYT